MFLTKKRHEAILLEKEKEARKEVEEKSEELEKTQAILRTTEQYLDECYQKIADLKKQIEVLEGDTDKNSVEIRIDDNITTGTPIVRYKQTVVDKLVEEGYLRDGNTDQFAIQLALLTISQEILTQLVESFAEPVSSD